MNNTSQNNRLNYIDALRGFTMFLVVFGHVMLTSFDLGGYDSIIGSIFLTFRMPLFFFIAGIFSYKAVNHWDISFYTKNVKKKLLIQIIPTFFFASLFLLCNNQNPITTFLSYGFGGYWFTIVLFEMFLIYYSISFICKYTYKVLVDYLLILCSITGIIVLVFFRGDGCLWDILCIENLTKYFQFFTLGILCKKHFNRFLYFISSQVFRGGVILLFITCLLLYFNKSFEQSNPLVYKGIHDIVVRYAGLIVIYISFYHYRNVFNKETTFNKSFLFIGRRTLDIYLLHYFFIPNMQFIKPYIEPTNMILIQFLLASIISIIIIFICLLISNVIRTSDILAKYLFGAKIN